MFRLEQRKAELSLSEARKKCPFDNLVDQERPTAVYWNGKMMELPKGKACVPEKWTTVSIPNKYPAFTPKASSWTRLAGPYEVMDGVGFHEVIVTKDHTKDIPQFTEQQVRELLEVYHARYVELKDREHVNYISIFKNKGAMAGATVAHPHSQLVAIPVTDPDIERSLLGSRQFFEEHHNQCVHCVMLAWDRQDKKRIVFENECYTVVCPFASRVAFEIRIYPSKHSPYFENIDDYEKGCLAEAFSKAMKKLYKALKDPDYNYFLHTSPADGKNYDHYHWHWEILPKTATWAGFELGAGIEISTIEPEKAAAFLRKQ